MTIYAVATDSFMSGWGQAPGRSIVVCAAETREQLDAAEYWLNMRPEMKRVRIAVNMPRAKAGDHVAVWTPETHPHVFGGQF